MNIKKNNKSALKGIYWIYDYELAKKFDADLNKLHYNLSNGISLIQLRAKNFDRDAFYIWAQEVSIICQKKKIPVIINDSPEIAQKLDCYGVHLGQKDSSVQDARKLLGSQKIIGSTAHNLEEALIAVKTGADYLGIGTMFASRTKPELKIRGIRLLNQVLEHVNIPLFPIGGIHSLNIDQIIQTGCKSFAISSCLFQEDYKMQLKLLY